MHERSLASVQIVASLLNDTHEFPLFNLPDRWICAIPNFKPTQIDLLLQQKPIELYAYT